MNAIVTVSNIGRKIYGFCDGFFGRDSWDDKTIEAEGYDWIVARDSEQHAWFRQFRTTDNKQNLIDKWSVSESEQDEFGFN